MKIPSISVISLLGGVASSLLSFGTASAVSNHDVHAHASQRDLQGDDADCDNVKCRVLKFALSGGEEFDDASSAHSKALSFLEDTLQSSLTMPSDRLAQVYALMVVFHSTSDIANDFAGDAPGPWTKQAKWGTNSNFCTWFGITCTDETEFVAALDLRENNLSGSMPNEMGLLGTSLLYLDLKTNAGLYNSMQDEHQGWLEPLNLLKYLDISATSLEYNGVPTYLSKDLEFLDFSFSNWQGPLEGTTPFAGMTKLEYLGMSDLMFMNCLAEDFAADLPNMRFLFWDNVELDAASGPCTIDWISDFIQLEEVWLDNTNTGGATIPTQFGSLGSSLETFVAGNAGLEGSIPTQLGNLVQLEHLWLYSNNLSGNIPIQLNLLNELQELFLEGNSQLAGGLIGDICLLPELTMGADCTSSGGGVVCTCCDCCSVTECEELIQGGGGTPGGGIGVDTFSPTTEATPAPTPKGTTADDAATTKSPSSATISTKSPSAAGGGGGAPAPTDAPKLTLPPKGSTAAPTVTGNVIATLPPDNDDTPTMAPTKESEGGAGSSGSGSGSGGADPPQEEEPEEGADASTCEPGDDSILCRLARFALQGGAEFMDASSYHYTAYGHIDRAVFDAPTMNRKQLEQIYALMCLHFSTYEVANPYSGDDPDEWKLGSGWRSNKSPCDWDGLDCADPENPELVTHVVLANNSLSGRLPEELRLLGDHLLVLDVSDNPTLHNDPSQLEFLGKLTHLQYLALGDTAIQYPGIPDWINQMTDLEHLDLHFSLMQGPLDGTPFVGLSKLTFLDLGSLEHTNCLPDELFSETALEFLYLDRTIGLEGCSLDFLGATPNLMEFWIDQTNTGGATIPETIGTLANLTEFSASFSNLTGPIPATIGDAKALEVVWLFQNDLSGNIPSEINMLNNLEELYLEGNPRLMGGLVGDICLLEEDNFTLGADCDTNLGGVVICNCCTCCDPVSCQDYPDGEEGNYPFPEIKQPFDAEVDAPTAAPGGGSGNVPAGSTAAPSVNLDATCEDVHCRLSVIALEGGKEFEDPDSYQSKALEYIFTHVNTAMRMPQQRLKNYYALSCLYHSTYAITQSDTRAEVGGWENSERWMSTVVAQTEYCTWYGVECGNGRVVLKLDLNDNNLHGRVPEEIVLLSDSLEELDLSYNPGLLNSGDDELSWMGQLGPNMKKIALRETSFTYDGIPPGISELPSIEHLDFGETKFRGPKNGSTFVGLSKLKFLALDNLEFDNCIPEEVATETNLVFFSITNVVGLSECDLEWVGLMENLVQLWMDHTDMGGSSIPPRIGFLTNLTEFTASFSNLQGTIPKMALNNLSNLKKLWLQQNDLQGSIPEQVNNLAGNLEELYLQGNPELTGSFTEDDEICARELIVLGADCTTAGGNVECACCDCCGPIECGDIEITFTPTPPPSPVLPTVSPVSPMPTASPSSAAGINVRWFAWWQGVAGLTTVLVTTLLSFC